MKSYTGTLLQRSVLFVTFASAIAPFGSIAVSQILLAVSFVGLLLMREPLRLPPIKLPLFLFFFGTVLSVLLSGHILAGWPQIRKFYVVFIVLLCATTVIRRVDHARVLVVCWIGAATASAAWGLSQFGRTFLETRRTGANLYYELVAHRMTGFLSLWMTFSGQLMIVLLMLGALLLFSPRGRRFWPLLAASAVVILLALVLGMTRGPWFGVAAGVVYLVWKWNPKALIAVPVLAVAGFFASPAAVRERFTSIVQPRSELDSNQHRIVTWRTGLEMIKAHPWFGLGPEQVGPQFEHYVPADLRPLPVGWYGHLHNIYLQYAAERGIPVLLCLLWLIGKALRDFYRAAGAQLPGPSDTKALLHGAIAAILGVLVAGIFEHNLGDSEMLQVFLTVIALGYVATGAKAEVPKASASAA